MNVLCPYCGKPWTREMLDAYNGSYGCDTGCGYVRIEITCASCDKTVYVKGEFGSFEDDEEKREYLDDITEEELLQIAKEERA